MSNAPTTTTAVTIIAAMVAPGLLIAGSASLVNSALSRMARIVDRSRVLIASAHEGSGETLGATVEELGAWLLRYQTRAANVERAVGALYGAVAAFVATAISVAIDLALDGNLAWLPVTFAVLGTLLLLFGGACMVLESRLADRQIQEEIAQALRRLGVSRR